MIDWVHSFGNEWGHWVRKAEAKQGAIRGTLGRIREEPFNGNSVPNFSSKILAIDFPEDVSKFHRAWLSLDEEHKSILWIDYKLRKPALEKFKLAGKKKDAYYRARSKAQAAIMYQISFANPQQVRERSC